MNIVNLYIATQNYRNYEKRNILFVDELSFTVD